MIGLGNGPALDVQQVRGGTHGGALRGTELGITMEVGVRKVTREMIKRGPKKQRKLRVPRAPGRQRQGS